MKNKINNGRYKKVMRSRNWPPLAVTVTRSPIKEIVNKANKICPKSPRLLNFSIT
ncbi:MAG TPA: hypothetical protein VLE47_03465 [Candidatus Saccharimonadales bacterium]|nr:hypothetical protein [Candidatus Saccharimonadales bacterium]